MGRNRKRNRPAEDSENPLNSTATSTGSSITQITVETLSQNFNKVLEAVQENGRKLDMVNDKLKTLDDRVSKLEVTQSDQCSQVAIHDSRIEVLTNENSSLKSQLSVLVDEAKAQGNAVLEMSDRLVKLEIEQRGKNIIVWNAGCESENVAVALFQDIVKVGLEQPTVPPFKVIQCKKDAKFFKVELSDKETKIGLLRSAKKLKNKNIGPFKELFLSDDATPELRRARKILFNKRAQLRDAGFDAWVSKSFPPCVQFKRPDGSIAKYFQNDVITELARPVISHDYGGRSQKGRFGKQK